MAASLGLYLDGDLYKVSVRHYDAVVRRSDGTTTRQYRIEARLRKKGSDYDHVVTQKRFDRFTCTCEAFAYRKARSGTCKHIAALREVGVFITQPRRSSEDGEPPVQRSAKGRTAATA